MNRLQKLPVVRPDQRSQRHCSHEHPKRKNLCPAKKRPRPAQDRSPLCHAGDEHPWGTKWLYLHRTGLAQVLRSVMSDGKAGHAQKTEEKTAEWKTGGQILSSVLVHVNFRRSAIHSPGDDSSSPSLILWSPSAVLCANPVFRTLLLRQQIADFHQQLLVGRRGRWLGGL